MLFRSAGFVKCLGMRLAGELIGNLNERGEQVVGDTLLLLLNAHHEAIPFTLPAHTGGTGWELLLDTFEPAAESRTMVGGEVFDLEGRSLVLFRLVPVEAEEK